MDAPALDRPHQPRSPGQIVDAVLDNPLVGLSPWIVYALIEGGGRLEESSAIAFGVALAVVLLGLLRGGKPKLLEWTDTIFFAALAIFVAVAGADTHAWLERWSGEIANLALVVIALGSIALRQPFTLAYAKENAPRELWDNPAFLRTNYLITWVWAIAFVIEAASGFFGDLVLDDSNNLWTGWIIQTLPLIWAAQFTIWYPQRVRALGARAHGEAIAVPPVADFLAHCTPWLTVIGVIVFAMGGAPWWVGLVFVGAGVFLTNQFKQAAAAQDVATT
jgi:hypothetical protein